MSLVRLLISQIPAMHLCVLLASCLAALVEVQRLQRVSAFFVGLKKLKEPWERIMSPGPAQARKVVFPILNLS